MVRLSNYILIFLLSMVLFSSFVFGLTIAKTPITVHTEKRMNFTLVISNPSSDTVLQTIHATADGAGVYEYNYYATVSKIKFSFQYMFNGELVTKDFGPFTTGVSLPISLLGTSSSTQVSTPTVSTVNNITNSTTNSTNLTSSSLTGITGKVSSDSDTSSSSSLLNIPLFAYILVGLVLVIGGGATFVMMKRRSGEPPHEHKAIIKTSKTPDLIEAERKIEALEHEVNAYKNREKIDKIQQSIDKQRSEIERLKRGY